MNPYGLRLTTLIWSKQLKGTIRPESSKDSDYSFNTFGDEKYRKQNCDLLRFVLKGRDNTAIEITALSFSTVGSDLPDKVDISQFSHLEGLELADESAVDGLDWSVQTFITES